MIQEAISAKISEDSKISRNLYDSGGNLLGMVVFSSDMPFYIVECAEEKSPKQVLIVLEERIAPKRFNLDVVASDESKPIPQLVPRGDCKIAAVIANSGGKEETILEIITAAPTQIAVSKKGK